VPREFARAAVNLLVVAAFGRAYYPAGRGPSPCLQISELARRAREVLVRRAPEGISLGEIARELGRSHYHVCRVFKAEAGIATHQYLHRVRIREALHRIGDGEEDLLALALDLGYSSHSHFTRFFHRLVGAPPSQVWGRLENGTAAPVPAGEVTRKAARAVEWLGHL
jgi:AraC-like DNA-binding protein